MRRLCRSNTNRMIGGVCGGIGETYDIDPTVVRLVLLALSLLSAGFPGLLLYIIAWAIVPLGPSEPYDC